MMRMIVTGVLAHEEKVKRIQAIYQRWPDFRERLVDVWAALRDTSVPARSRLKRAWRIVDRHLLDRPEWLSSRTESLRDIRYRRWRAERVNFGEKFHRFLHWFHTIERSSLLGAVVFVVTVGISLAIGTVLADAEVSSRMSGLAGTLVTIAAVLGGVAGILFAVIVFGIQFHGERLGQAAHLARYFGRREGLVPIAAVSLAVVAANVIVSLVCSLGLQHASIPMAILDLPLVVLILWFVLWLLHRMVVSVSADIFDRSLVPGLCWEYERAIDEEIHYAGLIKEYEEVLGDAGLVYSSGAGMIGFDPIAPVKFTLPGEWQVADVNLTAMRDLAAYIHVHCPEHEGVVAVGPQDVSDDNVVFVLSVRRDDQGRQGRDTQPVQGKCRREIQRRLRAVFRLGRVRERDVVEVLARFEKTIVSQARYDRADQLERGLGVLKRLIELRLRRKESSNQHRSFRRRRLADNLEGREYFDMVSNAVASGDREKVSALLVFACRIMGLAVRHENPSLYDRAGAMLVAVYYQAIEAKELADYVGERLDGWLHILGLQFEYAHSSWRLDPLKIAAQMPVLMVDLAWRLELVRAALEADRTNDATHFQDRLFQWDKHLGKRFADPREEAGVPPELREASDLMSYATLITAAWCLHLIESKREHTDTAKAVFKRCVSDLGSREHLLRLWETVRSKSFTGRPLDDPFDVIRWTDPPIRRTGVSTAYHISDEWIKRGFMALMLACPSSPKYEVPDAMRTCPPFRHKSRDEVQALVDSILANDVVRNELLNITDVKKREDVVHAVVGIIAKRLLLFKLDRLTTVISAPLRDEHRVQLHTQIAKELEGEYGLASTLAKLGRLKGDARAWFLPRIQDRFGLQKDSVVGCCEHPMDFAPLIARSIQEGENTWLTHAAEWIATRATTIHRLAELADAVRDAAGRLRKTTQNPILVFLPQERRIIEAIIGHQDWQLPNRGDLGDSHIGDWEGCHLMRIPDFDPSSVVVVIVDALAFYGKIEESAETRLDFDLDHPQKEEHDDTLRQAQAETDPAKIPETDTVTVLAVARFSPSVGLCDPSAALRVDLDLTRIGFAMVENEGVYHRPDCSLLSAAEGNIVHALAHRLPSDDECRTPCEHCRPEDWEEQAEDEVQDAIARE